MALFPLGILSAAGAGGAVAGSYDLLETQILGSNQSSVVFSSLGTYSSTYKHLQIRLVANCTTSAANQFLRVNGDSGNNYAWHYLEGSGSAVFSGGGGSLNYIGWGVTNADSNNFTASVIDILDPFSTTKNTTVRSFTGSARANPNWVGLYSGAWFNTASVTSISLGFGVQNLLTNSRFSLYGLKG
jgi:hypothetical protein